MLTQLKRAVGRVATRSRVYRVLPPGAMRTHAAVRFHGGQAWESVAWLVRDTGIPTERLSSALIAARAAFRAGYDDLLTDALDRLEQRFPQVPAVHQLRSDLHAFRGEYELALRSARRAQLLDPSSVPAATRLVRLSYDACDEATADRVAIDALRRFVGSPPLLAVVCKGARTPEQYDRIYQIWRDRARRRTDLVRVVRQLANGAMRTGRLAEAIDLYREAITMIATGQARAFQFVAPTLAGQGAWTAMSDLCRALDTGGVPFFFAAGSALGLVREGRPLAADDDIDAGVFEQDWDRDRLLALFTADPRFRVDFHPQTQKVGIHHRAGSRIDIFRFYHEDAGVFHDGVFVRWRNTPFAVARRRIRELEVPVPEDAGKYLTENYGDWRTPNSRFDAFTDDAPNVEVTWPEYMRMHFVRRAYRALVTGDTTAAARELVRAEDEELATRITAASAG